MISGDAQVSATAEDIAMKRLTFVMPQGRPARARARVAVSDYRDLTGGGHLLLSTAPGPDGCPAGTVALGEACYLDPGEVVEPDYSNNSCPAGFHLCSCGQCVRNQPPRPTYEVDSFFDISYLVNFDPSGGGWPAVATVDVLGTDGALLRTGSCALEGPDAPCVLAYDDGVEHGDALLWRAGGGLRFESATTPGADGYEQIAAGVAVTLIGPDGVQTLEPSRAWWVGVGGGRLPASPAAAGGSWTWNFETLAPGGATPGWTAAGAFEADWGELLIDGVVWELE